MTRIVIGIDITSGIDFYGVNIIYIFGKKISILWEYSLVHFCICVFPFISIPSSPN